MQKLQLITHPIPFLLTKVPSQVAFWGPEKIDREHWHASSLFSDARVLYVSATPSKMAVPPTTTPLPTAISSSPAKNTPTKLSRFLQYVEEHEGIKDVLMF